MKVSELIELLEEQDPDAEVIILMQRNYPMEYRLYGVATRGEALDADHEEEDGEPEVREDGARNDVFLLEGEWLQYGTDSAWNVAAR
jgi:hypothetical protein